LLKCVGCVSLKKIDSQDGVMQRSTAGRIDAEHLGTAGAFKEVGDEMFRKLLSQILTDHITLRARVHVQLLRPAPDYSIARLPADIHRADADGRKTSRLPVADQFLKTPVRVGAAPVNCQPDQGMNAVSVRRIGMGIRVGGARTYRELVGTAEILGGL